MAWSRWNPATKRYALWAERPGSRPRRLPVRPRAQPFDVDVGPSRRGRPSLVYSRCPGVREPRGCRIYRFSFAEGREAPVSGLSRRGRSDTNPAVWRGRLAFIRDVAADAVTSSKPRLMLRVAGRVRALTGGKSELSSEARGPSRLDLDGSRVSLLWTSEPERGCPVYGAPASGDASYLTQILVARYRVSPTARIVDFACNASTKVEDFGPVLIGGGRVAFLSLFEEEGKPMTFLRVVGHGSYRQVLLDTPTRFLSSLALDRDTLYITQQFARRDGLRYEVRTRSLKALLELAEPYDPGEMPSQHS